MLVRFSLSPFLPFSFCLCLHTLFKHLCCLPPMSLGFEMAMAASSSSSSSSSKGMEREERPHVLAVDDSLVDRKLIERLLTRSACKVTTAENGQRALEILGLDQHNSNTSDLKINLIITDYCMPGMTGYELLKKIKESPTMKEVPVVVVSSENVPTRIHMCLEEGADEFMLKPLKLSDVKKLSCHLTKVSKPCKGRFCMRR